MTEEPAVLSTRDVRTGLADAINDAIRGRTTYITQRGRRVAALVPLSVADTPADMGPAPAEPPDETKGRAVLRKHRVEPGDFLTACWRAVSATPDTMLKSLARFMPEKPKGR